MVSADQLLGNEGENIACGYLVQKGYKIIKRNFTTPFGELDIIAKTPDNMPVFIEVKTTYSSKESGNNIWQSYPQSPITNRLKYRQIPTISPYSPEMRLDQRKIVKLRRLCTWYANKFFTDSEFRIDGICVDIFNDGLSNIRHYKNIGYY